MTEVNPSAPIENRNGSSQMTFDHPSPQGVTSAQAGVWYAHRMDPQNPIFTIAESVDIDGPLQPEVFEQVLAQVVREAETLRVRFVEDDGQVRQQIRPDVPCTLRRLDVSTAGDPVAAATAHTDALLSEAIAPDASVLFDFTLIQLDECRWWWVQRYHHAVLDGVGLVLIEERVAQLYSARIRGDADPEHGFAPLSRLVDAERDYRESPTFDRDRAHWTQTLADLELPATLTTGRREGLPHRLHTASTVLPAGDVAAVRALARDAGVAWPVVLTAAWALYVGRVAHADTVHLGLPAAARLSSQLATVPGMSSNIVPLAVTLDQSADVTTLLTSCSSALRTSLRHQRYRYEDIRRARVADGHDERVVGPHLNLVLEASTLLFGSSPATCVNLAGGPVQDAMLVVDARRPDGGIDLSLQYDPELYDATEAATCLHRVAGLVSSMVANPHAPIADLSIATPTERWTITETWNDTDHEFAHDDLVGLLTAQASQTPDAIAVSDSARELTYAELHERSDALAHLLLDRGVVAENRVAVCLPRDVDLMVGLLAVLKAGAGYLPLDPGYPADRKRLVLQDAEPVLALTTAELAHEVGDVPTLLLDRTEDLRTGTGSGSAGLPSVHPDSTAYVIYTSGSTGRPKGVVISHRNAADFVSWAVTHFGAQRLSRVLASTSLNFDVSVFELFAPLACGGRVHLVRDLLALAEADHPWHGSLISGVPTALAAVLQDLPHPVTADHVVVAGEALTSSAAQSIRTHTGAELANFYGPTESTVYATGWYDDGSGSEPLIGSPRGNVRVYVLDDALSPVPAGITGELFLGGAGVARGYLDRPGLSAERFLPDPFSGSGTRMYRTGDVVRWTCHGDLEYLGRGDGQVKIRGHRIELGEIEHCLSSAEDVRDAVVVTAENAQGATVLHGYVVGAAHRTPDTARLREHLADRLPEYMVPAALMVLPQFPVNSNGKLDRGALPAPRVPDSVNGLEPATPAEAAVCTLMADLLDVGSVDPEADFLSLGGDSILAIQLANRARALGLVLTPRQVFRARTPREMVAVAGSLVTHDSGPGDAADRTGPMPANPIARWLLGRPGPVDSVAQSVVVATPAMRYDELETVLRHVIDHHDGLRVAVRPEGSDLRVRPAGDPSVGSLMSVVGADAMTAGELDDAVETHRSESCRSLSLQEEHLARVVWFDGGPDRGGRLLITLHHLLVDGVSWRIIMDDLEQAWSDLQEDRPIHLPPVPTPPSRWFEQLATVDRTDELDTWAEQSQTPDPPLGTHREPGTVADEICAEIAIPAPGGAPAGVAQDEILVAALALAVELHRRRHGDPAGALLVDLEGHGRSSEHTDLDTARTVGWLTSLYPVAIDLEGVDLAGIAAADPGPLSCDDITRDTVHEVIRRVRQAIHGVPDRGLGYGWLRHVGRPNGSNNGTDTDLGALPDAQICLNHLGRMDAEPGTPWRLAQTPRPTDADPRTPRAHVVEITTWEQRGADGREIIAHWSWNGSALPAGMADVLRTDWQRLVGGLTDVLADSAPPAPVPADFPRVELDLADLAHLQQRYGPLQDVLPLTPTQEAMLFHSLGNRDNLGNDHDPYTVQFTFTVDGPLDLASLQRAADRVVHRHPNLAARFVPLQRPVQVLAQEWSVPTTHHDLLPHEGGDAGSACELLLADIRARGFDPESDPLLRIDVVDLGPQRTVVAITHHHLLLDGWSMAIVARELFVLYADPQADLPTPTPFSAYLDRCADTDPAQADEALARQLDGIEEPTLVASDGPVTAPERREYHLDEQSSERLRTLARESGVTLSCVLQTGWGAALARHLGRTDVVFGATTSGRPADLAGAETMAGMFICTRPVRVRVGADSVRDTLAGVHDAMLEGERWAHVGIAAAQRVSGLPRLFDTLLVLENYPLDANKLADTLGEHRRVLAMDAVDSTDFPLTLVVVPGARLTLRVEYQADRLDAAAADSLARRWMQALHGMADDADAPMADVDTLLDGERGLVLRDWNDTHAEVVPGTLVERFERQVARTPDAVAVVFGEQQLTYREVDTAANRMARALRAAGVSTGDRVGVAVPRSAELPVSLYAVLKAGAAYVPVETDYPTERIAYVLDASDLRLVLVHRDVADRLPEACDVPRYTVGDGPVTQLGQEYPGHTLTEAERSAPLSPDHPAYVLYTSGSTGRPKGVVITHRGIDNRLAWMQHEYGLGSDDTVLQKTPSGFDVSVWEFFWAHQVGATLVLAAPGGHRDPEYLAGEIERTAVTTVHFVPSMLEAFQAAIPAGRVPSLRRVICSGEALPPEVAQQFLATRSAQLHNLYGPTEASVDVTAWQCREGERTVPIGRPIWNTRTYVLDDLLRPVPVGAPGDLYLAGVQLAQGYLCRPDLTGTRFVADPFTPGERMYATGDVARWRADGALEYLGRSDFQVKIRGQRVELEEIEQVLREHGQVDTSVVVAQRASSGSMRLIGYVCPETVDIAAVRESAIARLPEHMVPSCIVALAAMPLSANGKLDRAGLPQPPQDSGQQEFVAAQGSREQAIARAFADVLHVDDVGADQTFVSLGGDSVLSIQVVARLRAQGIDLSPKDMFVHRTPAALAAVAERGGAALEPAAEAIGDLPLTPMGRWLMEQSTVGFRFAQTVVLRTPGGIELSALESAVRRVVDHHPALRQEVRAGCEGPYAHVAERTGDRDERAYECASFVRRVTEESATAAETANRAVLDPGRGRLVAASWSDRGEEEGRLILTVHHLAVDGVSWPILTTDLQAAMEDRPLTRTGTSLRTWTTRLTERAEAAAGRGAVQLWSERLPEQARPLGLVPVDPAKDTVGTSSEDVLELDETVSAALLDTAPQQYRMSVQDVLLSTLAVAVQDAWTHRGPVHVQLEGHGRDAVPDVELSGTLGWFTSTYPVRIEPEVTDWLGYWSGADALGHVLRTVKEQTAGVDGDGFGPLRWLDPTGREALAGRAGPALGFNYLGRLAGAGDDLWQPAPEHPGILAGADPDMPLPRPLEVTAVVVGSTGSPRVQLRLLWAGRVISAGAMEQLRSSWLRALTATSDHVRVDRTVTLSPADVGLVSVSQDDLDLFEDLMGDEPDVPGDPLPSTPSTPSTDHTREMYR